MTARRDEQIQLVGDALALLDTTPRPAAAATPSQRLPAQVALALPCYNKPGPYVDIEKNNVREWAASQCFKRCTQLEWCEQQRQETVRDHGSAVGVWAGHVWTHSDYRSDSDRAA